MGKLHLTPELLRMTYEFFRMTSPFKNWDLPHADEVEFRVMNYKHAYGYCHTYDIIQTRGEKTKSLYHVVEISNHKAAQTHPLMITMAHEMVHVYLDRTKINCAAHGRYFKNCAKQVCDIHGFDLKTF